MSLEDSPFPILAAAGTISASTVVPFVKYSHHASGLLTEDDFKFKTSLSRGDMSTNKAFDVFESAIKNASHCKCIGVGAIENMEIFVQRSLHDQVKSFGECLC